MLYREAGAENWVSLNSHHPNNQTPGQGSEVKVKARGIDDSKWFPSGGSSSLGAIAWDKEGIPQRTELWAV
jgi:hypothetical protein